MATVYDVAECILQKAGSMSAMKLQKLVYYSQAWSLVWDDAPLFSEDIQAWAHGPVVYDLFKQHKGQFTLSPGAFPTGDAANLTKDQSETVEYVVRDYGRLSAVQLSELTHVEDPWIKARNGLAKNVGSDAKISDESMNDYYSSLSDTDVKISDINA